jgi:hypothetical protein
MIRSISDARSAPEAELTTIYQQLLAAEPPSPPGREDKPRPPSDFSMKLLPGGHGLEAVRSEFQATGDCAIHRGGGLADRSPECRRPVTGARSEASRSNDGSAAPPGDHRDIASTGPDIAFGARAADVLRLVFSRGLSLVSWRTLVGLGAALAVTRVLTSLLFDVKPSDPMTLVGFVAAGRCGLASLLHSRLPGCEGRSSRVVQIRIVGCVEVKRYALSCSCRESSCLRCPAGKVLPLHLKMPNATGRNLRLSYGKVICSGLRIP